MLNLFRKREPQPNAFKIQFASSFLPMMLGESRVPFLSALSSEKGEAILADSWVGMSEKTLKPKGRVSPTGLKPHVFREGNHLLAVFEMPTPSIVSEPLYTAGVMGPIDEEWNDERLQAAPLRYFVGLNTGPNQMEIGEMIEDQDPKVYGEGPKPDVYLFTEWILNEAVRGHKVTSIRSKDETMQPAMVKAQSMLPGVIERLVAGKLEHFSVKVRVEDGEDVEYCWLSETQYADGIFSGILDAEAQTVGSVEVGQAHQVAADDVCDWMYTSAGLMHGNFTLRAMLPQMTPPERAKYSKLLADDA